MLSWRHFAVHYGVGHVKLPHLGEKINDDNSHFWCQHAEVIQALLVRSGELARQSSCTRWERAASLSALGRWGRTSALVFMKRFKHSLIGKTKGDNRDHLGNLFHDHKQLSKNESITQLENVTATVVVPLTLSRPWQPQKTPGPWSKNAKLSESDDPANRSAYRSRDRVVKAGDQHISTLREALLPPFKHGLNNLCYSVHSLDARIT